MTRVECVIVATTSGKEKCMISDIYFAVQFFDSFNNNNVDYKIFVIRFGVKCVSFISIALNANYVFL